MLAQAAGTGASAGAAAVSESDMFVVVLWVLRVCVLFLSSKLWIPGPAAETERERDSRDESELVRREGAQKAVGGDKTCERATHVHTQGAGT